MNKKANFLWVLLLIGMLVPSVSIAANLYAIIVGDTNDRDIGTSATVDVRRMEKFMRTVSDKTGLRLELQKITGNQLTPNEVRNVVNRISPGADDVVFFYWSGHGYNRGDTVLPTMDINKNRRLNVDLKEIASTIRNKHPRLFIVIGDTCNKPRNENREEIVVRTNKKNYKKLFLQYRGEVLAGGSEVGGYSYGGGNGGFYTTAFLNSFRIELAISAIPSWKDLMERADKRIEVEPGIYQQPISNTNRVSYIEAPSQDDPCQTMRDRPGSTCGAKDDDPQSATGGCTDDSNDNCW